jgi:hypothetical protein
MSTFQGFSTRYANTVTADFRHFGLLDAVDYFAVDGTHYRIPRGAQSDLASIPQPLWSLLPPTGEDGSEYGLAAYGHDAAYRNTLQIVDASGEVTKANLTKSQCDNLLKEMMLACQVPESIVLAIYEAVNLCGQSSFNEDRS